MARVLQTAFLLGIVTVAACSSHDTNEHAGHAGTPAGVAGDPLDASALASIEDLDPSPDVLEVNLEARETTKAYGAATPTPVWSYNGTVPGPLLDAKVGDRVVVHFKNSLPEPTTIHWHGIRLPASMDGSLAMQQPIPPGGTFEYAFTLKDAGLYWFHPHMRSDIQVQKGLYGVIRVRGAAEPASDVERVLVLDDIRLSKNGTISEYLDDNGLMMGREGNTYLVNGISNARVTVDPGGLARLRLVNVANGRFFNIRIPGRKLRVIGTDGGLLPKPYDVDTLVMSPGERYDVMFVVDDEAGAEIPLIDEPYERGHASGSRPASEFARLRVSNKPRVTPKALPDAFAAIERLPETDRTIPIRLGEVPRNGQMVFTINDKAGEEIPPVDVAVNELRVLDLKNESEMDHPFHLHGFFFQVLARDGVPVPPDALANKDTIIFKKKSALRLVARFDEPGRWMYHCHILEHGEHGMMAELVVK